MSLLHLAIFSPFLMAIFVPFLYKGLKSIHTGWFVLALPILLFTYFIGFLPITRNNGTVEKSFDWIPSLGIHFTAYVDGLGLLFALLITGIGALVVLYSIFYLSKEKESLHNFYVYLLLFMGAMLGVVLSDNLITLYMFWELTSISSFLLIAYWYDRERSRYGALKSMLLTVFGGLSMLGGILLLSIMGDTFSIRELISQAGELNQHPLFLFALILILLGAFTKSAQFPFYIWLPDAMEAPTPVSAYLHSATMVKAGIYLVARLSPIFAFSSYWFWIVGAIGIFTMFWGSFNAVKQTDLKGILAFSTVSQLGLIMSLLGVGAAALHFDTLNDNIYIAAVIAAVFHLINHATFKGSLFMVVGIVDHETGTRDIRKLGGLLSFMPVTFTIAVIGAFSMAGLPPFNGFLSKEMFFTGMIQLVNLDLFNLETWGMLFPILAWIGSIFTFIYSMMFVFKTFSGKYQPEKLDKKPHEAPVGMLISPIILAFLVVLFGLFPNLLSYSLIQPAAAAIVPSLVGPGELLDVHISHWHGFNPELWMTIGVIAVGTLMYLTLSKWIKLYALFPGKVTLNALYDTSLYAAERGSYTLTKAYMNGFIRTYLVYIFAFFIGILGFTMWTRQALTIDTSNLAPIGVYEIVLVVIITAGIFTILFAKSRLTSIIALGAVGYTVSLFFVIFRAPDLALTQLVIETVSVALFLLCFYHLPKLNRHEERMGFKLGNLIISLGVGAVISLMAISAHSNKMFESIASFYVENTYKEAAGKNMVNVILVDFRGFDTLFEISVLAIAGLGIFGLIKLRLAKKGEEADEN
ncbi:Na+/H+ antiporter subunit A [Bacillus badius]|uniref:Na(+) H(+) antiporter subunit A n=1 Tax=Bacillus badius TaxID=1455 RepID=A0ABR5AXQ2_BACBA|nr:Na+/H+ antiporter subunit A [Bacillus badius]KIL75923.1 Na(+) H(+) antiporter subunit A [Bacillus badius]KIL79517.1 Na(+) H(+) antiporter subunit A [Bacillus badius]KZO00454.1 cation:proton antiporter [Bacillus badius]KZR59586.1 cation:proton antiporter [Bacillus badius]MED4716680.1 Na+/H+ antiporter subunit A [Bacillus badius]